MVTVSVAGGEKANTELAYTRLDQVDITFKLCLLGLLLLRHVKPLSANDGTAHFKSSTDHQISHFVLLCCKLKCRTVYCFDVQLSQSPRASPS